MTGEEPRGDQLARSDGDPRRIVVSEGLCNACSTHTVHVHHASFPELQVEGISAEEAADHLAERLSTSLGAVSDSSHREAVERAIGDARAFLDHGAAHPARGL